MKKISLGMLLVLVVNVVALIAGEMEIAGCKATFYGFIKTDIIYDAKGNAGGELMIYPNSDNSDDKDFRITARGSRFGMKVSKDKISAKFEMDFFGADAEAGNKAATVDLRLRHAYVDMNFGNFSLLAGQTWNLTPLEFPGTNNDMALGYSGCLWYRVPQLRITFNPTNNISAALAVTRPTRNLTDSAGTASGKPGIQAYIQGKIGKSIKLTLSGAYGQWKADADTTTSDLEDADVYLVDLGYNISLNKNIVINGQIWYGQNLYDFLGGIGQVGYEDNEVKAKGGFVNLKLDTLNNLWFNFCYGIDDPKDENANNKKNSTIFANINTKLLGSVVSTLEVAQQKLDKANEDIKNTHIQLSFKYNF